MPHGPSTAGNPVGDVRSRRRRPIRRAVALVWLILVLLLALIAGYGLAAAIADTHYDPSENPDPIGLIAKAAVAFAATVAALAATRRAQHPEHERRPGRPWWFISVGLTVLAVVLVLYSWIFILTTGPR